nr:IgGFc-binding protein [Kofleriaceae bacterium]
MRAVALVAVVAACGSGPRAHGDAGGGARDGGDGPRATPDAMELVATCADAEADRSYIGCEYWAVDLHNALEVVDVQGGDGCSFAPDPVTETLMVCAGSGSNAGTVAGLCDPPDNGCPDGYACAATAVCVEDAQHAPFAVVVSNPQPLAVDVTMTGPDGTMFTQSIAPGAVAIMSPQGQPQQIPDQSLAGTEIARRAYRLVSTLPIVAYQFNPLSNVGVFSNDASLLIPRTAFDTTYYAMSWPTDDRRSVAPGEQDFYGYLTVVAWQDGTVVEVTPTAAIQSSATQTSIAAGTPTQFTLNAFDVLNLEAVAGGDLTGSKVTAVDGAQTFGVFGGHVAAEFGGTTPPDPDHTDGPCCADHLEEMLFPTSTWGKTFAIARSQPRIDTPDLLRVLAERDGTTVAFDPAPATGSCSTPLAAGQFCQVEIQVDTEIVASAPVSVGHYLESAIWADGLGGTIGTGDPSMAIAVPVEQYRSRYVLPVPIAYDENYFSISTTGAGPVLVDGAEITLKPFGAGSRGARVLVKSGAHTLTCPDSCGVEVYGYSDAVSYQFAGGLDLKQIIF